MRAWCNDPDDLLRQHLDHLATTRDALVAFEGDEQGALAFLDTRRPFTCALGQQGRWSERVEEVRAACAAAESARRGVLSSAADMALTDLRARMARFVRSVVTERRRLGTLARCDVLVLARRLLHSDAGARASLAGSYRCVLVDALD